MKQIILSALLLCSFSATSLAQNSDVVVSNQTVFSTPTNGLSYHNFRIPALLVTKAGTFLAFSEGREGKNSDHAENDIVLRRSLDEGKTWLPEQIIAHDNKNCTMNPVVVEGNNGRIILSYLWFPNKYHSRAMPKEDIEMCDLGFEGEKISRNYVMYSDDQGVSWSKPIDVTNTFKLSENTIMSMPGPGNGITVKKGKYKGRIILPLCDAEKVGEERVFRVYSAWSDDNGLTWSAGEKVAPTEDGEGGNEVQIVEISDNTLLLNSRSFVNPKYRVFSYSKDGGATWSKLEYMESIEDTGCMGSMLSYKKGKVRALFATAVNKRFEKNRRGNGLLYRSLDEGKSWEVILTIYDKNFDYSCLQQLPNGNVGMLGEYDFDGERSVIKLTEFDIDKLMEL